MCDYSEDIVYIRHGVELSCFDYMNHMTPTFYLSKLKTCPAASKNMKNTVFFFGVERFAYKYDTVDLFTSRLHRYGTSMLRNIMAFISTMFIALRLTYYYEYYSELRSSLNRNEGLRNVVRTMSWFG